MLRQIKRWLGLRQEGLRSEDDPDCDSKLRGAMREHLVSTRLVRIQATKSAKALKQLSDLLAIRAKAIDSISAAEDALAALDKGQHDDK